ncbi:gliding motility-associated C-terminal domain-containing protein [Flavobacterium terrae]|uniref:Gliding motility-associated C-terminal domain-containing protein n=1 Tax=Flavobacterium terrae TaxID=415425 RepID=A0A1M6BLN0_9FLAO|nr:gliding motility-associated C-terminal domain-containing protein [Flavobacterium terrae]SHI49621.1 gliding motility-associated C-terminal domain-containing protein [Flavobacterium terrae]
MDIKILKLSKKYFFATIIALALFFTSNVVHSQCAGNDANITICDITNPTNQSLNLFTLLGGTPTPGGFWIDDLGSGGLNSTTGILNVHQIRESGIFTYTYMVTGIPGCVDNTATVTVLVGPYAGVGEDGSRCGDDTELNLFELFNYQFGNVPPQTNGYWFNNTTGTPIAGYTINPSSFNVTAITVYNLTYTIPALGPCPESSISVNLTLVPPVDAGTPQDINLCSNADLSLYTNVNLYNLLTGEDSGGTWTDNNGTGELSNPSDSFINIQNIYNNFGAGTYSFTYKVLPISPICDFKTSVVRITIEDPIDYSGILLQVDTDVCQNQVASSTFTGVLTQSPVLVPNGTYDVTYTVSGQATPVTITVTFNNGIATFNIPSANFPSVVTYSINVTNIVATNSLGICVNPIPTIQDNLTIYPVPTLANSNLAVDDVCQNNSTIAQLNNLVGLADGTYIITYDLSGSNTASSQTTTIVVSGGSSAFSIPGSLLPNSGTTSITITAIQNGTSGCSAPSSVAVSFMVNPLPTAIAMNVSAPNSVCLNQPVVVSISGLGTLTNVTINYDLSGANNSTGNVENLTLVGGGATFTIPQGLLTNTGNTTITITGLANNVNSCGVIVSNVSDVFLINSLPVAPLSTDQTFCESNNPTVANLVPSGSQYFWYDTASSTVPLSSDTPLVSGGDYYVSEINANGCESTKSMIVVTVDQIPAPVLTSGGEQFCGTDNPTIQDLSDNTNASTTVVWYDALTAGNLLSSSQLLQEGVTYYGFDISASTGCISKDVLSVTVTLTNCNETPDFFIPDGFSPNGDGVNDTFTIPDIQFIYPDYKLEIYNRYGNLMFEGNKDKPNWDGKNSTSKIMGDVAPNGVYFYVVYFNKNNKAPKQGRLYLNR